MYFSSTAWNLEGLREHHVKLTPYLSLLVEIILTPRCHLLR